MWQRFSLDYFLKKLTGKTKLQFDLAASIFAIVLARLMAPSSKLQVYHCQPYYYGQQDVSLQHLYRCLDRLADAKESLETHLFERNRTLFNATVDIVFYDVTTLYFESILADEFKNFGYSKDCKFNEVQVVVGLLLDNEGRPIGFDVYPDNTFEGKTLTSALEKLKHRFNMALCGLQWVIEFHLSTQKINHVDKILGIAEPPRTSFSELNLIVNPFQNAVGDA